MICLPEFRHFLLVYSLFFWPRVWIFAQVEEAMADAEAEALRKQRAADEKADRDAATRMVIDELKILYKQKLMPVEQTFL